MEDPRSIADVTYREASPAAGPADARMAAYLEGRHHPQQALAARVAFVTLDGTTVIARCAADQCMLVRLGGDRRARRGAQPVIRTPAELRAAGAVWDAFGPEERAAMRREVE